MPNRSKMSLLLSALFLALSACGGRSTDTTVVQQGLPVAGGSGGSGTVVATLTDATFKDLTSFTITVTKVELENSGGNQVGIFPPASNAAATLTVDLLTLQGVHKILSVQAIPADVYTRVKLDYTGATAVDTQGVTQTINPNTGSITLVLKTPLIVLQNQQATFTLDFKVKDSLTPSASVSNAFQLAPVLAAQIQGKKLDLDEFEGQVTAVDAAAGTITVQVSASAGQGPRVVVGDITVKLDASTVVETRANALLTGNGAQTMAALQVGQEVEVKGVFDQGTVTAGRIEIEKNAPQALPAQPPVGGAPNTNAPAGTPAAPAPAAATAQAKPLRLRGLIARVTPTSLDVLVLKVARDPQGRLAGKSSLAVDLSQASLIKAHGSAGAIAKDALVVGAHVEVDGDLSASGNFKADELELRTQHLRGTIASIASAGNSLELTVSAVERRPASALSGLQQPLTVEVPSTATVSPAASAGGLSGLKVGDEVEVEGIFSTVTFGRFVAREIEAEAQEFKGKKVAQVSASGSLAFDLTGDGRDLGLTDPVTVRVTVAAGAQLFTKSDATGVITTITEADLRTLLSSGKGFDKVEVKGRLTAPQPPAFLADQVKVKLP